METAIVLAQVLSLLYAAVGVGMLRVPEYYERMIHDVLDRPGTIYLGGVMALLFGVFMLRAHSCWPGNVWSVFTLVGWLAVLKGLAYLIFPQSMQRFAHKYVAWGGGLRSKAILALLLAAVFAYMGFCPDAPVVICG